MTKLIVYSIDSVINLVRLIRISLRKILGLLWSIIYGELMHLFFISNQDTALSTIKILLYDGWFEFYYCLFE
jgi:hypothetical protein